MKAQPEDFRVSEVLGFEPEGDGPHLFLLVEKRELNSDQAARLIAREWDIAGRDVGYAGLKDRQAVTRQWFSVPATATALERANPGELLPGLKLLSSTRHRRKLRRGANRGNGFEILVRNEHCGAHADVLEERARCLRQRGVPNYFGAQRFGRRGANIAKALRMLDGRAGRVPRHLRSLYLSSARSALFNQLLARRVAESSWDRLLPGEAVVLDGRSSYFVAKAIDAELERRLAEFDVHPSGPLWGRGDEVPRGEAAVLERGITAAARSVCDGLASAGLTQERRALRLGVPGLRVHLEPGVGWRIAFELPAGTYATSVLRELFDLSLQDASAREPAVPGADPGREPRS